MFKSFATLALLALSAASFTLAQSSVSVTGSASSGGTATGSATGSAASSGTSGLPGGADGACLQNCSQASAIKNGCVTFTNVTCVCGSAQFQADTASCITIECPELLAQALASSKETCGPRGITPSGSVTSEIFTQTALSALSGGSGATGASGASGASGATGVSGSNPAATNTGSAGFIVTGSYSAASALTFVLAGIMAGGLLL
ncbi:hypothetical protein C8J56DRAFT_1025062 [Mycena floridula]|nr:hypothetical protein C8J56DRAFT_1025062 [Mycena floridula]